MRFYTTKAQESIISFDVGERKHFWIRNELNCPLKNFTMKLVITFEEDSKAGTGYKMEIPVELHPKGRRWKHEAY